MTIALPSFSARATVRRLTSVGLVAALVVGFLGIRPAGAADLNRTLDITFPAAEGTRFSNDYLAPRGGGARTHCGTDILGPKHSRLYAARGGTITSMPTTKPSYGYTISIAGDDGLRYTYIHLNDDNPGTNDDKATARHAYAPGLSRGSKVSRGQFIGYMGDSGNAKGTDHLHFEIHDPAVDNTACASGSSPHRMNPYNSLRAAVDRNDYGSDAIRSPLPPVTIRSIERACPSSQVQSAFTDVAGSHAAAIDCIAWWRIAQGISEDRFGPDQAITREQLATFLARKLEAVGRPLPPATTDHFEDDAGSVHEDAINRVAGAGLVNGTGPGTFGASGSVTRGQMASMLARGYTYAAERELPTGPNAFYDNGGVHEASINGLAAAGIAGGGTDGLFRPGRALNRAQMASFIARTLDLLVAQGQTSTPRR